MNPNRAKHTAMVATIGTMMREPALISSERSIPRMLPTINAATTNSPNADRV